MTNRPKSGKLTTRNLKFLNLSCNERGYSREERPHGGYKGVSRQYPLSAFAFDKPADYMTGVKKTVDDHYEVEKQKKLNAPAWVGWANKARNHTGEQALIVQKYLAGNKLEQAKGTVPSYTEKVKERCNSTPNDPDKMLVKSNSMHQYLTSTDRYGESAELVDITLGRPTRASLLRIHHRSQSAPQVRAPVENKMSLHRQQMMAIKKGDKHRTVDVPKNLQPITQNGESIYEFLVGARYNRSYCADSTCMSKLGLYVSRDDPLRCFLHRPFQTTPEDSNFPKQQHCEEASPPLKTKFAWEKNETALTSGRSTPRSFSSARSTPREDTPRNRGANKMQKEKSSHDHGEPYCVMCYGGMPKRGVLKKNTSRKLQKDEHECTDHSNQDEQWKRSYINILEQNYHLNIMGTRVGICHTKPSPARGNLHHSSSSTHYRQNKKANRPYVNNNHYSVRCGSSYSESKPDSGLSSRFGSEIHVGMPVMETSGEGDLVKVSSRNETCTCKVSFVKEANKKTSACQKNDQNCAPITTTANDGKYTDLRIDGNGKAIDSRTKQNDQTDGAISSVSTEKSGTENVVESEQKNHQKVISLSDNQPLRDGDPEDQNFRKSKNDITNNIVTENVPQNDGDFLKQNDGEPEGEKPTIKVSVEIKIVDVCMKGKDSKISDVLENLPNSGEAEDSLAEQTKNGKQSADGCVKGVPVEENMVLNNNKSTSVSGAAEVSLAEQAKNGNHSADGCVKNTPVEENKVLYDKHLPVNSGEVDVSLAEQAKNGNHSADDYVKNTTPVEENKVLHDKSLSVNNGEADESLVEQAKNGKQSADGCVKNTPVKENKVLNKLKDSGVS
ncbi:uncharacterized protein [Antedon mediterranea]|uniref:uncharacterized protein n=1 Tax=Antedon mediterranea TaxID=105859 RepID=UPI003AF64576